MSPSRGSKVTKTKTFAGCWTCRRRKVKCDNNRPCCRRCGDACEGYNVNLYWMDDANERACAVKRSAMLISDPLLPLSCLSSTIDRMLERLEEKTTDNAGAVVGPFTAFRVDGVVPDLGRQMHNIAGDRDSVWLQPMARREMCPTSPYLYHVSIYVNDTTAELMHNYIHVVSQVLQPVYHPHNPYRSIHAQQAITAGNIVVGNGRSSSHSGIALSHALLAVSAFHLYGYHPRRQYYGRLAEFHRLQALLGLRNALAENEGGTNYRTLMSAMLSMVSIDLMEGGMTEFWIHLQGCQQLLDMPPSRLKDSSPRNELLAIESFMNILSRSTNPNMEPIPWDHLAQDLDSLLAKSAFISLGTPVLEYTYGITASLASYLELTISLSRSLSYYKLHEQPIPRSLSQIHTSLHNAIYTWSISHEALSSVPEDDYETRSLISCHAIAFHAAIAIYFYSLSNYPIENMTLKRYNQVCLSNLLAAEALKSSDGTRKGWSPMAPIVWPGFIAGCEAEKDERPLWQAWWNEIRKYRLGSIETLRKTMLNVWQTRDAGRTDVPGWMVVLRQQRRRVMSGG